MTFYFKYISLHSHSTNFYLNSHLTMIIYLKSYSMIIYLNLLIIWMILLNYWRYGIMFIVWEGLFECLGGLAVNLGLTKLGISLIFSGGWGLVHVEGGWTLILIYDCMFYCCICACLSQKEPNCMSFTHKTTLKATTSTNSTSHWEFNEII